MNERTKKMYDEFLLEICKDESRKLYTRDDILMALKNEFDESLAKKIHPTKLSRDLKSLKIRRMRIGTELMFRYDENMGNEEKYPVEFFNYVTGNVSNMGANIRMIKIPVQNNCENIVCEKICAHFGGANIICIPAYESVCVITSQKHIHKLKDIRDELNAACNER